MVEDFNPKIIGFFCNWCTYPGIDLAGQNNFEMPVEIAPIRVMCSGRVAPNLILNAFLRGADGVLLAGCHPGECHYESGNLFGRRRFALIKTLLDTMGLESQRIKLAWYSAHESQILTKVINDFTNQIQDIGPNPIKEKSTL
jgi:F420-non-reducing hydrogenase iron-sulfur subunit